MAINDPYEKVNRYLRRAKRDATRGGVDLTVTPAAAGAYQGQINAGSFIYKTASGLVASLDTPGAANANTAQCVGISCDNYPWVQFGMVLPAPDNDSTPPWVTYRTDGEHLMKTTAADTYAPNQLVYLGADGRTVTTVASGSPLGRVCFDQAPIGAALGASISGAQYPEIVIEFVSPVGT